MKVDIICPLYNAEKYINNLQKSFEMQENVNLNNIRYILTEGNDNTEEILKKIENCKYKKIDKKEFSHSLTRESEAFESDADIIVFVTQDVIIQKKDWLFNLIKSIEQNECKATFSRQICTNNSIEKYTRESNYPKVSRIVSKNDIETLGLKTFFFSDASSAIDRKVFVELNGYDQKKLPTNEDMYFAYKLITKGYKIKYCADSEVIHSHDFSLKETFQRYKAYGQFLKQEPQIDIKSTKAGGGLAKYILKRAIKDKNLKVLIKFIPNMLARFLGMKVGKR